MYRRSSERIPGDPAIPTSKAKKTKCKYPILGVGELCEMMSAFLSIQATASDMENATADFVRHVYLRAVEIAFGMTREEVVQVPFSALDGIEYPQLCDEAFPELLFHTRVETLMQKVHVKKFEWKDVSKPKSLTFIKQLSGIINFLRFRDERIRTIQETQAANEQLREEKLKLAEKMRQKKLELAQLEEKLAAGQAEARTLGAKTEEESLACMRLSNEERAVLQKTAALKAEVTKERSECEILDFEMESLLATKRELAAKIEEAERLPGLVPDIAKRLEENKSEIVALQDQSMSLTKAKEVARKFTSQISKTVGCFVEVEKAKKEKKTTSEALKALRNAPAVDAQKIKECDMKLSVMNTERVDLQKHLETKKNECGKEEECEKLHMQKFNAERDTHTRHAHDIEIKMLSIAKQKVALKTEGAQQEIAEYESARLKYESQYNDLTHAFIAWKMRMEQAMELATTDKENRRDTQDGMEE